VKFPNLIQILQKLVREKDIQGYFKPLVINWLSRVFLFIGRTKSVLPDEKKKKEYFRRFSNLIFMLY